MHCQCKNGFTLIEISIVLVIIGLIVGGILVGTDLINASIIRSQITQIEKYHTAVNTFRGKYGGLPGDLAIPSANSFGFYTAVDCVGGVGQRDGNGLIAGAHDTFGVLGGQLGESLIFWADLSSAGLISDQFPGNGAAQPVCNSGHSTPLTLTSGTTYIGDYLPAGKIGYGTFVQVYNTNGINYYSLNIVNSVDNNGGTNAAFPCGGTCPATVTGIPASMAYAIDAKIDDGLPHSGSVTAYFVSRGAFWDSQPYGYSTYPADNGCYSGYCALSFKFQ